MRLIERLPADEAIKPLRPSKERQLALRSWLISEVEDAFSSLQPQHTLYTELLKVYEGVPDRRVRNIPFENAPNVVVTLAAIASDAIYAQAIDLIFSINPTLTVRVIGTSDQDQRDERVKIGKAMQRFVNMVVNRRNGRLRAAADHTILDDVQLGTGVFYIPWIDAVKKTDISRIKFRGPMVFSHPIEDFIVPGGSNDDLQLTRWMALRFWPTEDELIAQGEEMGINVSAAQQAEGMDFVRSRRETLGRTNSGLRAQTKIFEILNIYCSFDIDGDGEDEELLVFYDRTSQNVMGIKYGPYDRRPTTAMRYQIRAHLFAGIGVIEMMKEFQREVTDTHNARMANMLLANTRIYKGPHGIVDGGTMKVWPGRFLESNDADKIGALQLADVYPSATEAEAITISLAERRAGFNDITKASQLLGSRTPATTALSGLQQLNRRFAPAFESIRIATADAAKHCLYRYQERVLEGDTEIEDFIRNMLGLEDGDRVILALRDDNFDDELVIELTASSASLNRDLDKQNNMMLVNILIQYYQRILELIAIASNPQVPQPVKDVAVQIAEKAGEVIERTLRTFDNVRDPETFIVEMGEAVDSIEAQPAVLGDIQQLIGGAVGNGSGAP